MLPVSGAEQLKTSEAQGTRPIVSLRKAYSRLERLWPRRYLSTPCRRLKAKDLRYLAFILVRAFYPARHGGRRKDLEGLWQGWEGVEGALCKTQARGGSPDG